jgi:hypothetical protein
MDLRTNDKIYGVPDGIYYGQNERVDELNDRIYKRNLPDINLAPNFDPRPVPTKYSLFPIVNRRAESTVRINPGINHIVEMNFYPGTANAPPFGYLTNVDTETVLRNQTVALQHGADQGVYIPSLTSDLYKVTIVSRPSEQPFPNLFKRNEHFTHIPTSLDQNKIGKDVFMNNTRVQLRNPVSK